MSIIRYSINGKINIAATFKYDVAIIGAGIAGLYTALALDNNISCCILAKEDIELSNSWLAQGGIAAAVSSDDAPHFHLEDTLIAGAGYCDEDAVRVLVDEGPADIKNLISMNVPFDLDVDGELQITLEGGHHKNRIVHAGGDATGRETVKPLAHIASQRENIKLWEHTFCVDIVTTENGAVSGLIVCGADGNFFLIKTKCVVIATGGIGQIYKSTTNPAVATGDGIAAAMRAGAKIKNIEFIQFHPTGLWSPKEEARAFLISEAVRGEGGLLKNSDGVRFMKDSHELAELAPRDIVARAVIKELARTGEDHVFIDITAKPEEFLAHRFPTIYNECLSREINMAHDYIPVCPVQHYLIGGIETDINARTSVPGLYACGEAACTGVHGANRLASNSMLECLVFGRRAAQDINILLSGGYDPGPTLIPEISKMPASTLDYTELRGKIRQLMSDYGHVIRNEKGLTFALAEMDDILSQLENCYDESIVYSETLNMTTIAKAVLAAALARPESAGAHYRED